MSKSQSDYEWFDDAALALGLGFVLIGVVVMGVVETFLGSGHFTAHVSGLDIIIVHISFTPHIRAYVMTAGLLILLAWGLSRIGRVRR